MASVNPLTKEILLKVVYYGPGLGGKTTTLQHIHKTANPEHRGKMVSLATPVDRTLYFDFLPVRLPKVGSYTLRLQLFTVPGQVHYNATRKLVLTGADGTVFVADSQISRMDANVESLENLKDNLAEQKIDFDTHPVIFQYNKRDLKGIASMGEMEDELNSGELFAIGTCALTGEGVYQGLELITKKVLRDVRNREILIHDDRSTSDKLGEKIAFKIEKEGILDSVKDYSESSSERIAVQMNDEETATFSYGKHMPAMARADSTEAAVNEAQELETEGEMTESATRITTPAEPEESTEQEVENETKAPSLSFVSLCPASDQYRIISIESAISEGRNSEAIQAIRQELERLLSAAGKGLSGASIDTIISILGLSGSQYLEIARQERLSSQGKEISGKEVLKAYLFLLQTIRVVETG
ncbi:MAG: gliding motility protein [Deltaproteobacteria bacterium]|nr:gliding motility protein [Deltaproteobacteria bacterium]